MTPFTFQCLSQLPSIMDSVRYGNKTVTMEPSHAGAVFPSVMIIFMLSQSLALFAVSQGTGSPESLMLGFCPR